MRPFRVAILALLALSAGCATSESAESKTEPAPGSTASQATSSQATSKPRAASSKGRVLRTKESVLTPESGSGLMRSDRASVAGDPTTATQASVEATELQSPLAKPAPVPEPVSSPSLSSLRGISRPNGPIEVLVQAPEGHGPLAIVVLDRAGNAQERISVTPGTVDLAPLATALERADRALWLQLTEDERAVGQPLWFVPLRAAPPVRTVRSIRASTQQPYQRVVGWGDRAYDPNDSETAAAMPSWSAPDPIVTSGFRIEPAQIAVLHTGQGDIRVAFAPDAAPATVENFLRLAREGFFDGTTFHRVVPLDREGRPFVIQGGDPTGTGDGGPGWNLALEPSDLTHDRGVLGMARGDDPHSAGSQFYISLSREGTARLDGQYCTFGMMLDGWDTLDRIAAGEIGDATTGRPAEPVHIERVELLPAPPRDGTPLWTGAPKAEAQVSPSASPER